MTNGAAVGISESTSCTNQPLISHGSSRTFFDFLRIAWHGNPESRDKYTSP